MELGSIVSSQHAYLAPQRREVLSTLKRKAAEQPLSVTQNILSEVLADSTPETNKKFARAARLVVFLAFVPIADVEDVFYEITYYIQSNYPQLMAVVNYFENTYLGSVIVDKEERVPPKFPLGFWNHYSRILKDPEFPRTSNMVEGFHRGFRTRVNRPKPSVQEYFRAIREQQVTSDYHIDRLGVGKTPSKRRKTSHEELFKICSEYSDYSSKLDYLYAVAKHFGHDIE